MSSDSDIALVFKAWKECGKAKKERNQKNSTAQLDSLGIKYETHNWGNHLVVSTNQGKVDFWPSTGRFIVRKTGAHGRGVRKIIKMCSSEGEL